MTLLLAAFSALAMGLFYILDMFFESRGVYRRPSQAMIISAIIPLLSVPFFLLLPDWQHPPLLITATATVAGIFLIWANWFYFLVMFPVDKANRDAEAVEGATELALYEGTTPAVVLLLSLVASQFLIYTDTISTGQSIAVLCTVLGLVLFATADGYVAFSRWSYRLKLIAFTFLVAVSQLLQDHAVNTLQVQNGFSTVEAFVSTAPFVWIGMFSGILILLWKHEWSHFVTQWKDKIRHYAWLILTAEIIALASFAALIGSYTGEHVAVAGAIAASFPIVVFIGGLLLQRHITDDTLEIIPTKNIGKKLVLILLTLIGVIGVVLL